MPDSKITALASTGTGTDPANDPLVIVDVSDTSMAASGTTKKVTLNNLLACSPTATLASATISGDLTVRTTGLVVNSTGTGVQVTPSAPLCVKTRNSDSVGLRVLQSTGGTAGIQFTDDPVTADWGSILATSANLFLRSNSLLQLQTGGATERLAISSTGVCTWSNVGGGSGTAMTLNSTGLGVGVSPAVNLDIASASTTQFRIQRSGQADVRVISDTGVGIFGTYSNHTLQIRTNGTAAIICDTAQNVGIGVTPSAWGAGLKALQVGARGYGAYFDFNNDVVALSSNLFWTGSNYGRISASSKYAVAYFQDIGTGAHQWLSSSAAGTNGVAPTMNTNMVLDASGNLLVGKTAIGTTVGIEARPDGYLIATRSASTDGAAFTNAVYSTGASAYRFYVGLGGTVFATNTTISAISDARFKENVQDIDVGLGAILALKPRKFDWKAGKGKDIKGDRGFIAQEFEQVFPQLVDEWADPAPEGEAPYKSVRQDLIPVLVKAIQELAAEVNALKNA